MKKLFLLLPICVILLTSCNLPFVKSSPVSASLVNTKVAQTLQAKATSENLTQTIQPTLSLTATPTLTPKITSTPTVSPDDPRLTLGTATYTNSFNDASTDGSAFGLKTPIKDDAITFSIKNGSLLMTSFRLKGGPRWRLAYQTPRNLYLEGTFKTVSCQGADYYGLVYREPAYDNGIGYYFGISCDGKYYLMRYDGSDPHVLVDWTADPAILSGSNQENRIGVMVKDDQMSLYINGKLITKTSNDVLKEKGHFGVFQYAVEDPNMTVQVEEINEWNQP